MGRGKRDITRTRRILKKILDRMLFKQIAFEEDTTIPYLSQLKSKYIDETVTLTLNAKGLHFMNEEQLTLPLHRTTVLRITRRLRNERDQTGRKRRRI